MNLAMLVICGSLLAQTEGDRYGKAKLQPRAQPRRSSRNPRPGEHSRAPAFHWVAAIKAPAAAIASRAGKQAPLAASASARASNAHRAKATREPS